LASDPSDTNAMFNKGLALVMLGKYDDAIKYYDEVLSIEPDNKNAQQSRVQAAVAKLGA